MGAIALGLLFIVLKGIEYAGEYREHLVPGLDFRFAAEFANGAKLFFIFYYVATAIHALHMLIGIGLLAVLARLSYRAQSGWLEMQWPPVTSKTDKIRLMML